MGIPLWDIFLLSLISSEKFVVISFPPNLITEHCCKCNANSIRRVYPAYKTLWTFISLHWEEWHWGWIILTPCSEFQLLWTKQMERTSEVRFYKLSPRHLVHWFCENILILHVHVVSSLLLMLVVQIREHINMVMFSWNYSGARHCQWFCIWFINISF